MTLDQITQRIKDSKRLSEEDKQKLICIVEWIRSCINTIRDALHRLIQFLRTHQEFCKVVGATVILAMLASLIPFIGQLIATLTLIAGLVWAVAADLNANVNALLQLLDMEKGATQI